MTIFAEVDDEDTADRIEAMLPDFALDKVRRMDSPFEHAGTGKTILATASTATTNNATTGNL
ncbi:MAG: hypothetical protein JZU55_19485 [Afipia sp.]|nr:hypothetical protein [Afipia sp.]